MSSSRTLGLVAIAVSALSLSACSYECGTARHTVANGTVRDAAGSTLATAQVDLTDNLRPSFLHLTAGVMGSASSLGAPLRGHVTHARLVTATGELIAEIPIGTETLFRDAVVALNLDLSSDAEYTRVRNALLSAGAKIILETDIPGRERIETTLSDARDVAPNLGRCNPVS